MQVREGESCNPTVAPTLPAGEERGGPATNKQHSKLTMKMIVMLMIIMIIVLFCFISLVDYYSSSVPLFPYFFHCLKTPLNEASRVEKHKTFLRQYNTGTVGCTTTQSTSYYTKVHDCATTEYMAYYSRSYNWVYGLLYDSTRLSYNRF